MDEELKEFARYFKKQKENTIKYHVIKGTVNACKLNDDQGKFYSNSSESMNKLLNHGQSYKKTYLYPFAKEYEELVQCQESDALKGYLGLKGPYEVREEFKNNMRNFNTEYASLSAPEIAKLKELLLNVAVKPKAYTSIMKFEASDVALDNTIVSNKNQRKWVIK